MLSWNISACWKSSQLNFSTTNIVYAGRSEQTHDLPGAKIIPTSLKTSFQLPLQDSSQGLANSQNEFESKTVIMTTS